MAEGTVVCVALAHSGRAEWHLCATQATVRQVGRGKIATSLTISLCAWIAACTTQRTEVGQTATTVDAAAGADSNSSACDAWCVAKSHACSATGQPETGCSGQCLAAYIDGAGNCATQANALVQCLGGHAWSCQNQTAVAPAAQCAAQQAAYNDCQKAEKPGQGKPEAACTAACAAIGKKDECKEFAQTDCLDDCAAFKTGLKAWCEDEAVARWQCAAKAKYDCAASVGASADCGVEIAKLSACQSRDKAPVKCTPGEPKCDGKTALKCNANGNDWTFEANCTMYGSQAECVNGKCIHICTPGETKCESSHWMLTCDVGGNGWQEKECTGDNGDCAKTECNATTGKCATTYTYKGWTCPVTPCQTGACDGKGACAAIGTPCDDKIDCTVDECQGDAGCSHAALPQKCDDGDACTVDGCGATGFNPGCYHKAATSQSVCKGLLSDNDCLTGDDVAAGEWKTTNSWSNAENNCTYDGGHLATFTSKVENDAAAAKFVTSKGGGAWFGVQFLGGKWVGPKGEPLAFTNFAVPPTPGVHNVLLQPDGSWKVMGVYNSDAQILCRRPIIQSCSDSNACTQDDVCQSGTCKPGTAIPCDDGNACTADSCDAAKGCQFTALPSCSP